MNKYFKITNKKNIIFYITVFILIITMLFFLSFNHYDYIDKDTLLLHQIEENNDFSLNEYFKEQNILKPENIRCKDSNYYYLLGYYYYNKHGIDNWCEYLLEKAFSNSKIFKEEAFNLYEKVLIKQKKYNKLKRLIKKSKIKNSVSSIILAIFNDKIQSIKDNIDSIPNDKILFPILNNYIFGEYAKNGNDDAASIMEEYFLSLSSLSFLKQDHKEEIKNIFNRNPSNIIFKFVYYYINKDKNSFNKTINDLVVSNVKFPKLEFMKNLSKGIGLRYAFYKKLKDNLDNLNDNGKYLYILEAIYYKGYNSVKSSIQRLLSSLKLTDAQHLILEYFRLHNVKQPDNKWADEIVNYISNSKDNIKLYSYKEQLLVDLFQKTIYFNKTNIIIPILSSIDIEDFTGRDKAAFYYKAYLIDKTNKEKWALILAKDYPFSYGNLKINMDNVRPINIENKHFAINEKSLSSRGRFLYKKAKYYATFNFFNELYRLKFSTLTEMDKIIIFNDLSKYFAKRNDYYRSIGYAKNFAKNLYGDSLVGIDKNTLLRIFPLHYKSIVFKYSKKYNIDPAFVYAIMREESHFAKEIVSYAGAIGLMQIMPSTGRDIAERMKLKNYNLSNPTDNIKMGCFYINYLRYYYNRQELILSCYNAGPGNTQRWQRLYRKFPNNLLYEMIPIKQTRDYIKKVMRSYYIYKYILQ